jgi:hypothetical protein
MHDINESIQIPKRILGENISFPGDIPFEAFFASPSLKMGRARDSGSSGTSRAVHPTGLLAVVGRQAPRSHEVGVSTMPAVGVAAKVENQRRASFWQNEPNFV